MNLIVVDKSFTEAEQKAFVDCLHESHADIHVLALRDSLAPQFLLADCKSILSEHPGTANVHGFEYRRAS